MSINDKTPNGGAAEMLANNLKQATTPPQPEPEVAPAAGGYVQPTQPPYGYNGNSTQAGGWEATVSAQQANNAQVQPQGLLGKGTWEYDVPWNNAGGRVQEFFLAFQEAAKKFSNLMKHENEWEFQLFDAAANNTIISAILFIRRAGNYTSVFPILVPESDNLLQDKVISGLYSPATGSYTVSVPTLPEELLTAADSDLAAIITEYVRTNVNRGAASNVYVVGGRVLPLELTPKNTQQIELTLFYANAATEGLLSHLGNGGERLTLASKLPNERLVLRYEHGTGQANQVSDGTGMPVRSDIAIRLSVAGAPRNQNMSSLARAPQREFSSVHGYMSFNYAPTHIQPMVAGMMYNPYMQLTPIWQPVFIINRMDNQFGRASLETQLLALASAASLTFDNNWLTCIQPNYQIREENADPRDIGNLIRLDNYQGEEPQYINTKVSDFSLRDFSLKYFHQNLIFQLDIPELGDLTYLQSAFLEASGATNDTKVQQAAQQAIVDAANYLTNGAFATKWAPHSSQPIVYNELGRVEVGYHINEKGELRDLADIDTVSLLTMKDVSVAREYLDSFNPSIERSDVLRFNVRQNIYKTYFPNYKITGYARRLTVNSNFLIALGEALREVGGVIDIQHTTLGMGQTIDRTYHSQVAGIPVNAVAGFVHGYMNPGQGGYANNATWRYYAGQPMTAFGAPAPAGNYYG